MAKVDRDILLKTLAGYEEVNRITTSERRARLKSMTPQESMEIFVALYETWEKSGKKSGGDWEAIKRRKLEDKIRLRRAFETLALKKGLI